MPEGEARWIADPTRRHELRWWNGARWTEHVCDAGVVNEDWGPKGAPAPRPRSQPESTRPEEIDDSRGLLEEPPHRQREREWRRTVFTIIAVVVILAVAVAVVVTVNAS